MKKKSTKRQNKFVIGRLSINARGFGFVTPESEDKVEDIFIPPVKLSTALNGDKVRVKLQESHKPSKGKIEGRIVKVLERVNEKIIGTYHFKDGLQYVSSEDARFPQFILIKNARQFSNLKNEMTVAVEIIQYSKPITGIIIEIIGDKEKVGIDILSVIRKYGISEKFPVEVLNEAKKISQQVNEAEISKRIDRRNLKIVTIDGEDAKDLDDGVYAEEKSDGTFFLGVYIADVSHYVKENSLLDKEAYERGTSIYPVDRVIPMLPKELSNGICSINAGVDRLSMACEMVLDSKGAVKSHKIFPTVIHVDKRLTYTAVNKFLNGDDELKDISKLLLTLKRICELRRKIREQRGAIDFDLFELKVLLNDKGKPIDIIKRERNLAESIIEECMLIANETVAKHMFDLHRPFIYRVHEEPSEEKIETLNNLLATFGLHINKKNETLKPIDVQKVLNKVKGTTAQKIIDDMTLRSMQQARYTSKQAIHFGLAAEYYTHFTSPIRRYPDLIVHRLLRELFEGKNSKLNEKLETIAIQSSERERRAVEIERETTDLKVTEYMQKFIGKHFKGTIVSVTKFGFFVELENGVDGLVRIQSLTDDFYEYVEKNFAITGKRTGKMYKIGDEVKVKLIEANVALKQITFTLKEKIIANDELIVE